LWGLNTLADFIFFDNRAHHPGCGGVHVLGRKGN
jgi:hypothetical protein